MYRELITKSRSQLNIYVLKTR